MFTKKALKAAYERALIYPQGFGNVLFCNLNYNPNDPFHTEEQCKKLQENGDYKGKGWPFVVAVVVDNIKIKDSEHCFEVFKKFYEKIGYEHWTDYNKELDQDPKAVAEQIFKVAKTKTKDKSTKISDNEPELFD